MSKELAARPEIESFNLADLDVGALDVRLELTTLIPACTLIICTGNCDENFGECHIMTRDSRSVLKA